MLSFLTSLLRGRSTRSRARTRGTSLQLENLEARTLLNGTFALPTRAFLDFNARTLTANEMSLGGFSNTATTVNSFRDLFTAARPWLDLNGDGSVNSTDANLAINRIVAKVKDAYSPYDLDVLPVAAGDQPNYSFILSSIDLFHPGDAVVMITGGSNVIDSRDATGQGPEDPGNLHDNLAFVFGGRIAQSYSSADRFINHVARTIAHEMGHTFGLEHVPVVAGDEPLTHHIMGEPVGGVDRRDFDHTFVFPNTAYKIEGTQGFTQNAHEYLTYTLGSSTRPWMAVLSPGVLEIHGGSCDDTISVMSSGGGAQWVVTINGVATTLDANRFGGPGLESRNPFSQPLGYVWAYGNAGNDTITIDQALTPRTFINGGDGNDTIYGGGGDDGILGGTGIDYLYGRAGNDYIRGDEDSDVIYGGSGRDTLEGSAGNDYLDGGDDGLVDILTGGDGRDTFVRHGGQDSVTDYQSGWDTLL
jgi:hypothetical protein